MRIAVTSRGTTPFAGVDRCFGRAYFFIIFDLQEKDWFVVDNHDVRNALGNAGQMASGLLQEHDVQVVITGETGPKAYRSLSASGVAVFHGAYGSVMDALQGWISCELVAADRANNPGSPDCLTEKIGQKKIYYDTPKLVLAGVHFVGG